ncbi:MAG TPA: hypothetical protein VFE96_06880 [Candidatus Bathyarchaeia archaeon]|jgi:hypothetical protein|nr:hypothetical protein [Candidatus Bathyarchaeia archaeon]
MDGDESIRSFAPSEIRAIKSMMNRNTATPILVYESGAGLAVDVGVEEVIDRAFPRDLWVKRADTNVSLLEAHWIGTAITLDGAPSPF